MNVVEAKLHVENLAKEFTKAIRQFEVGSGLEIGDLVISRKEKDKPLVSIVCFVPYDYEGIDKPKSRELGQAVSK